MAQIKNQIKSRKRVANHAEVFTHEREVNAMLNLAKQETERIDSRFLEQACGSGNFLIEILNRKLNVVKNKYKKSQYDYERYSLLAITSIYGIDILKDNVEECIQRLLEIFKKNYISLFKKKIKKEFLEIIVFILQKNIIWGDALSMKNIKGMPIIFSEWSMPYNDMRIKRKDYVFKNIIAPSLLENFFTTSDTGEIVVLPNIIKDYPIVNYQDLKK